MNAIRGLLRNLLVPVAVEPSVSLEAAGQELEYEFYGRIKDFGDLKKAASKEEQEQWEIRSGKDDDRKYFGGLRVRKINDDKYVLCAKVMSEGNDSRYEVELDADKDLFEAFRKISPKGMRKTRYLFPIEGTDLTWEVDVYRQEDGSLEEWCKIDLEVKEPIKEMPPLPMEFEELFTVQRAQRTPEQQEFVDELMNKKFLLTNQYPKPTEDKCVTKDEVEEIAEEVVEEHEEDKH